VGRAETGSRHEGVLQLAYDILPIYDRVYTFSHKGLSQDANTLRDSVLVCTSTTPFRADIHARAIMLHVVWDEFRARGNLKDKEGRGASPLVVADLNDQLWQIGLMLQSENDAEVEKILDPDYKPFSGPDNEEMAEWFRVRDARTVPTVSGSGRIKYREWMGQKLRSFGGDEGGEYRPLLLRFLRLFGKAIHESLTRTCSEQLSHMRGKYSSAEAEQWMKDLAADLLSENDLAESPFAKVPAVCDANSYPVEANTAPVLDKGVSTPLP
jgi:hypothetical protein